MIFVIVDDALVVVVVIDDKDAVVVVDPRNLPLKFGWNSVSIIGDIVVVAVDIPFWGIIGL